MFQNCPPFTNRFLDETSREFPGQPVTLGSPRLWPWMIWTRLICHGMDNLHLNIMWLNTIFLWAILNGMTAVFLDKARDFVQVYYDLLSLLGERSI
jgi:hypothetical protein